MRKIAFILSLMAVYTEGYSDKFTYKDEFSSEHLARRFFGKSNPKEAKHVAMEVGQVSIDLKAEIDCGNIDISGSITTELQKILTIYEGLVEQFGAITGEAMIFIAVCEIEPEICTHIRDLTAKFDEVLALNINACQVIDNHLSDKADQGKKSITKRKYAECMNSLKSVTIDSSKQCMVEAKKSSESRDILQPYSIAYTNAKQKVLERSLKAAKESEYYDILAKILGEVEIKQNGLWVKAFPEGRLSPKQIASNFISESQERTCKYINSRARPTSVKNEKKQIDGYIQMILDEKITTEIEYDLKSLPEKERDLACQSLGRSVGQLALMRFESDAKSTMVTSTKNSAIPDDIKDYYLQNTKDTFEAISKDSDSRKIPSFEETTEKIRILASSYRKKSRSSSAESTRNKVSNKRINDMLNCVDAASCKVAR